MDHQDSPYLLIFRDATDDPYAKLSADERQQFVQQWNSWFDGLTKSGKLRDGRPLHPEGRTVSGNRGERVTDGPFAESKEAVAGFFLISVSGIDEATTIAQQCPGLAYGMNVEVRPVADCCRAAMKVREEEAADSMVPS